MIGLLIITHEKLGSAYQDLAKHIFPNRTFPHIRLLNVESNNGHEHIIEQAQAHIQELNHGDGVLILTDVFGATPCNAAMKLVRPQHSAMITGLNAPMLIKAVANCEQSTDLNQFVQMIEDAGIQGIMTFTEVH